MALGSLVAFVLNLVFARESLAAGAPRISLALGG